MWFIRQQGSAAPVSLLSTTVEELPSFNERSCNKSEHDPWVSRGVTSSAENEEFNASPDWHLVSFVWGFVSAWSRTATAITKTVASVKPESRVAVLTAGRDVHEERLCVCPASGVRWIVVSPDGTWIDVHINLVAALRNVTGKANISKGG